MLVVGLGGGALPMFLRRHWAHWAAIDAVELDAAVVAVAEDFFGFQADGPKGPMSIHVGDGIEFVHGVTELDDDDELYDAIFIDANASDAALAMAFPPAPFLTEAFLRSLRCALREGGIAVMNVSCRSSPLYAASVARVRHIFNGPSSAVSAVSSDDSVLEIGLGEGSLNRLVVATRRPFAG